MSTRHTVALLGFSVFERETLQASFRLAGERERLYEIDREALHSDLIVANADLAEAVRAVRTLGRLDDTLFIGNQPISGACAGQLPRPIDALRVQRALDDLLLHRSRGQTRPGRSSILPLDDTRGDRPLVVSDNRAEQLLLREMLGRLGHGCEIAHSGEEALLRCRRRMPGFVFLGVGIAGLDPFQTCRQIKRQAGNRQQRAPVVVMLTRQTLGLDRIRATLAGCDAYLPQPLREHELLHLLLSHEEDQAHSNGFEPTVPQPG